MILRAAECARATSRVPLQNCAFAYAPLANQRARHCSTRVSWSCIDRVTLAGRDSTLKLAAASARAATARGSSHTRARNERRAHSTSSLFPSDRTSSSARPLALPSNKLRATQLDGFALHQRADLAHFAAGSV